MKNGKLLTVVHIASGDLWAGAEAMLFSLAEAMVQLPQLSLHVILLNPGLLERKLRERGIPVIVISETGFSSLQILLQLIRTLRILHADVVHTHRLKENVLGSLAALLAGRIPAVMTIHGAPEHNVSLRRPRRYLASRIDRFAARFLFSAVIAVSSELAAAISGIYPESRLLVIENGINRDDFIQARRTRRNRYAAGHPDAIRIGIAGRLVPVKRVDLFIRTAHFLRQTHRDYSASWHIHGDGPLRGELEKLCADLDLGGLVHFHGHSDEFCSELSDLDILMMTSDHEGTPMVLLEALAMEIPVIAHATGGIVALLDQGNCGTLVSEHTPEGYAQAVLQLIDTGVVYTAQRQAAVRNHLEQHYSAMHCAERYAGLYTSVARQQSA